MAAPRNDYKVLNNPASVKEVQDAIYRTQRVLYVDNETLCALKADPTAHMHFCPRPDGSMAYMGCEVVVVNKKGPYYHIALKVE